MIFIEYTIEYTYNPRINIVIYNLYIDIHSCKINENESFFEYFYAFNDKHTD